MIRKINFNENKMNLKTKVLIFFILSFLIIYTLDKFFDTYTFVSPIKKLEFQFIIQPRKNKSLTKSVNLSIIHRYFTCPFERYEKTQPIGNCKATIFFKTSSYESMERPNEWEKRIINYRNS